MTSLRGVLLDAPVGEWPVKKAPVWGVFRANAWKTNGKTRTERHGRKDTDGKTRTERDGK
jgi:hypothetical protein